jgi:hypothetical protein
MLTYGEGGSLRGGEAESVSKGRYIIRVGWDDVSGFLGAVSSVPLPPRSSDEALTQACSGRYLDRNCSLRGL